MVTDGLRWPGMDYVRRKLLDLQLSQLAQRSVALWPQHEVDELGAIRDLARETCGALGYGAVVEREIDPITSRSFGPISIGFYLEPAPTGARYQVHVGRPQRKTKILFRGESHRELVDQITLWRSLGSPKFW